MIFLAYLARDRNHIGSRYLRDTHIPSSHNSPRGFREIPATSRFPFLAALTRRPAVRHNDPATAYVCITPFFTRLSVRCRLDLVRARVLKTIRAFSRETRSARPRAPFPATLGSPALSDQGRSGSEGARKTSNTAWRGKRR